MGLKNELPRESLEKIKKSLYSCKTVDQVTTVINWVGRLKLSKSLENDRALYASVENAASVLTTYLQNQG